MPRLNRFTCPKCGRQYEVPPALTGLPLLCKGCGTPLTVPAPPDEPEPEPEPPPRPKPKAAASPPKPAPVPAPDDAEDDKPFLIPEPDEPPAATRSEVLRSPAGLTPTPNGPPTGRKPSVPKPVANPKPALATPAPPSPAGGSKLIAVVVDVAVGLILLAAGVFVGEMLARKSTRQVWNDAGGAVNFPPVELIQWAAPPVLILLVYALLASRGLTLGGWLKRRGAG